MTTPASNNTNFANNEIYKKYKTWNSEKMKSYFYLVDKRYAEESETLNREIKAKIQQAICDVIDPIDSKELTQLVKDIKNVEEWLKEMSSKTAAAAEKTLGPSAETVKRTEKAVVKQRNKQGRGSGSKNTNKNQKWRPKNSLPDTPAQSEAVQNKQPTKTVKSEFKPLKTMPFEKFKVDPLQADFKKYTAIALQVSEIVTGSEKNEFAPILEKCKEMLDSLKTHILLAQKAKETLSLLSGIVDKKNTDPNEFAHDIYPLRNLEKQLNEFVNQNENAWNEMLNTLQTTRDNSKPLKISQDALVKGEILCKPRSSETDKDVQPRLEIIKEQNDRIKTREANYQMSYYCLNQMKVHIDKLKHRIGEIERLYSNYPTLAKYKKIAETFDNQNKHILGEDNMGAIVDESFAELYKILAAKEIIDLLLEGNDAMESQFRKDYNEKVYPNYQSLFNKTYKDLKKDVEDFPKKIAETLGELDKIITENDIKDYSEKDKAYLKECNTAKGYNKLLEEVQLRHRRMYAAITQKLKLQAILEKMDLRMNTKASAYSLFKISQGFIPLYNQFNDLVKSPQKQ